MLIIHERNVNDAYDSAVLLMQEVGRKYPSRNGAVTVAPVPVVTVYNEPTERVLFNEHRDANPFFHLFESLWMLSGSDDATWLDRFVSDFSSRFAEEDGRQWGSYGHRWRQHFLRLVGDQLEKVDQLDVVVQKLRADPFDRRVVIQMWDVECDLSSEMLTESGVPARDVPCNTQIYLRVVDGALDMTVTCRSNDVVWGCYGANAVHFSFLQEYLAGRIGVVVGQLYQVSNNWHLYEATENRFKQSNLTHQYPGTVPIGKDWDQWDTDLEKFMNNPENVIYANEWFLTVARPMWVVHQAWRSGLKPLAVELAHTIAAPDWRLAALQWMGKRL